MKAKDVSQKTLLEAVELQSKGEFDASRKLFLGVLKREPSNFIALHSLAVMAHNEGKFDEALMYSKSALQVNPSFAMTYFVRGSSNFRLQNLKLALRDIEQALKLDPSLETASHLKSLITSQINASQKPVHPETFQRLTKALDLQNSGQLSQAKLAFQSVLEIDPDNFASYYSLGVMESQHGDQEMALAHFTKATEVDPDNNLGHFALGTFLQGMGLQDAALASFDRAIELDPTHIPSYSNKTTLLHGMNRHLDAIKTADAALQIKPDDHDTLCHIGYLYTEFKKFDTAATYFSRLLQLAPEHDFAEGLHLFARLHSCDWSTYQQSRANIIQGLQEGRKVCNPFALMSIIDDASLAKKCAKIFGPFKFAGSEESRTWKGPLYRHNRKRVAFISSDFREHPVGYLLIGMIEAMKRDKIELTCISLGIRDGSELYNRYRLAFDNYIDCADKTSSDIAQLMLGMEIDIAIDLSGYTAGSRLDILAQRVAPIQMTYLGYPGTLALPYIDYLIADKHTIPQHLEQYYSEKIVCLPKCYLPRDSDVVPAQETKRKSDYGLPENGRVLCSFNHDYKINPPVFGAWMDIMKEFPDTTLWLMRLNDDAQSNLTQAAIDHGVDPTRIVYATRVPSVAEHLARYRLADLFLDTYPYNGHTTSSDALLSGLPVITISGEIFASRVAGSLLHDYNLSELIAKNVEDYKQLIRIHLNPSKNAEIKLKLAKEIEALNRCYKNEERAADFENILIELN